MRENGNPSHKNKWIPTGVYPDANRDGNDNPVSLTIKTICSLMKKL